MTTQLREFTKSHARELLRDRYAIVVILVSFLVMLGLFWGLDLLFSAAANEPAQLLKSTLGIISLVGTMGLAFAATTVPLVRYRSLGTLRQLSTTPARAGAFLLGHLPIRAVLVLTEGVVLAGVVLVQGNSLLRTLQILVTLLLGGVMLLALGYFVAARLRNLDVALQLAYLVPMFVLVTSGVLLPLNVYPWVLEVICRAMPTTWFVETLNAQITGASLPLPLEVAWTLMALVAVGIACLTLRLMRFANPT